MATIDAIKKLHTSMIDTRRAYQKALEETEVPTLESFFRSMVDLREKDHDKIHRVLIEMGEKPNEDGSFMTIVHKAVIGVRSAIKGVDRDSLSAFASGEENLVKEYDDALNQEDLNQATSALLQNQRVTLLEKIEEMKALGAGK